jgi:hypothetical protein
LESKKTKPLSIKGTNLVMSMYQDSTLTLLGDDDDVKASVILFESMKDGSRWAVPRRVRDLTARNKSVDQLNSLLDLMKAQCIPLSVKRLRRIGYGGSTVSEARKRRTDMPNERSLYERAKWFHTEADIHALFQ